MKIAINALSVYSGGGLISMTNLLPALAEVDERNEYVVIVSARQENVLRSIPERFVTHVVRINSRNVLSRLWYEQLVLPFVLWRLGVDWLYSVGNLTSLFAPCKVLLLIENANPYSAIDIPWSTSEKLRNILLRFLGFLSARKATRIRFLSENSREIMSRLLKISSEATTVIPHGCRTTNGMLLDHDSRINLPKQFILTVSNIAPHKNIHILLDAFEELSMQFGYPGTLVIVGEPVYEGYFQSLKQKQTQMSSGDRVMFLGWISPTELSSFYPRADIFVLPSVEETFGLPVLEAMKYGVPVIVPRNDDKEARYFIPYSELCGDSACYYQPFDPNSLCIQMQRLLIDQRHRAALVERAKERAKRFQWEDVARKLSVIFSAANKA